MRKKFMLLLFVSGFAFHRYGADEPLKNDVEIREIGRDGMRGVEVVFPVEASKETLWGVLTDYSRFQEIFPDIQKLKVIHQDAQGATVQFHFDLVIRYVDCVLYRRYDPGHRKITWRQTQGDLKRVEGAWIIESTADEKIQMLTYLSFVEYDGFWSSFMNSLIVDGAKGRARAMAASLRKMAKKPG